MDIETRPGMPAVTRVIVDRPAVPAKVILELSQAEVLLIASALAHVPVSLLEAAGFGGYCCDQLARAAGLDGGAWMEVLTPEDGRLDIGRSWAKTMEPMLNQ